MDEGLSISRELRGRARIAYMLLQHGTDLTDYDIGAAATKYGVDLVMADIKRDGRPHTAVGIEIGVDCRVGPSTAYPHPNQFLHNKITRGQAIRWRERSTAAARTATSGPSGIPRATTSCTGRRRS